MIELSRQNVHVQPYYVSNNRQSEAHELQAIREITDDMERHPDTRAKISPLIVFKSANIEKDSSVTEAHQRLARATKLGTQYDYLARFSKKVDNLVMSLEKSRNSKAYFCILKFGGVARISKGGMNYYCIDKNKSTEDLIKVFGNYIFSFTWDYTKQEEMNEYIRLGFEQSLKKTWFCFNPVNEKPCGSCNPCKSAIRDGMKWRFDRETLYRYNKNQIKTAIKMPFHYLKKGIRYCINI
jgi:7-cyano-7-deazaguanine synthase